MSLVSIIIPVYYNAPSLSALAERLSAVAQATPQHTFEFIYVDDGSGDNSFDILCTLADKDERIRVIKLVRNFGSNMAILAGMSQANGSCVGCIAADLQDPPETIPEMIALWETGNRVVLAERQDRQKDPWLDRYFANLFNFLFSRLLYKGMSPHGIGFFLIDRQVTDFIINCQEKNAHLIGLILWSGYKFVKITYERAERIHGKSRWTFAKKVKYFIDAFVAFSYLPLRLSSFLGLTFSAIGGLYAIVLVYMRLTNQVPIQGWTAMMIVTVILAGMQLLILGVIGEYLWRSFDAIRQRPLFIIESTYGKTNQT